MKDEEIDVLFGKVDDLMLAGNFDAVDKMFVWKDDVDWVLTLLTASLKAKSRFPNRKDFYDKAEKQYGIKVTTGLG